MDYADPYIEKLVATKAHRRGLKGLDDLGWIDQFLEALESQTMNPYLSQEASQKIEDYYLGLRQKWFRQRLVPITSRQLEGLIRFAEASAKNRLSAKTEEKDVDIAIQLFEWMLGIMTSYTAHKFNLRGKKYKTPIINKTTREDNIETTIKTWNAAQKKALLRGIRKVGKDSNSAWWILGQNLLDPNLYDKILKSNRDMKRDYITVVYISSPPSK